MPKAPGAAAKRKMLDHLIGTIPDPLRTYEEYRRATSQDLSALRDDELRQEAARARLWLLIADDGDPADPNPAWWRERIKHVEMELTRRGRSR